MIKKPNNYSDFSLGPDTTGKTLIPRLRAVLEEDKRRREEQIEEKVRVALTEALEVLIHRAKEAVPENPESIDQIATFLNASKILKSALTAGTVGRSRVEEVFTRARFYIEDYLTNPRWENASPESKMAIRNLGDYLKVASHNIMKELDDVRSLKAGLAQQNSRVKKILDAISDPRDVQDLYDRSIPSLDVLATWVADVSRYFMDADDGITRVGKTFRPSYIKAWNDFIDGHFPSITPAAESDKSSYQSGRRFEDRLTEMLNKQLLKSSMDEFQKLAFTSEKFVSLQNKIRESSGGPNRSPSVIPIEMRASAARVEIILRIPESQAGNLNRIQSEAFLDLNEIIGEHEASVKIDSKNAGRLHFLTISTRDAKDREWIADLQGLVARIAERTYR